MREQAGRHSEAVALYEQALVIEPRGRDARLGLALALRRAGQLPEAAQQYALLGELGARDSEFLVNRGELYLATGQLDAAERDFEAALAVNPRREEAIYNLGVIALRRNDPEKAEAQARRALEIDPTNAETHLLLGNIAVARGDFVAAASEFGQGVALDSTNVQLLVNQGAALLNTGDFPGAVDVLRRSIRLSPTAHAWVNLAEAEKRSGAPADAEASYRAALALDADMQAAKRGLGLLLASDPNRAAEARSLLAPLAALLPVDEEVRAALAALGKPRP
jgi:tetratricopeptide (TPR) repeat protein